MLCQKCGLTEATVHRSSQVYRQTVEEHLCSLCADTGVAVPEMSGRDPLPLSQPFAILGRCVGETVYEKQRIPLDATGHAALRTALERFLAPADLNQVSLAINGGQTPDAPGKVSAGFFLSLYRRPPVVQLQFLLPPPPLVFPGRDRLAWFFLGLGKPQAYGLGWECTLRPDAAEIADFLLRLFTEGCALPPAAALTLDVGEWVPAPGEEA